MSNIATLPLLLKSLSLPGMCANWENQAKLAEESCWSYPEYLASLRTKKLPCAQESVLQDILKRLNSLQEKL